MQKNPEQIRRHLNPFYWLECPFNYAQLYINIKQRVAYAALLRVIRDFATVHFSELNSRDDSSRGPEVNKLIADFSAHEVLSKVPHKLVRRLYDHSDRLKTATYVDPTDCTTHAAQTLFLLRRDTQPLLEDLNLHVRGEIFSSARVGDLWRAVQLLLWRHSLPPGVLGVEQTGGIGWGLVELNLNPTQPDGRVFGELMLNTLVWKRLLPCGKGNVPYGPLDCSAPGEERVRFAVFGNAHDHKLSAALVVKPHGDIVFEWTGIGNTYGFARLTEPQRTIVGKHFEDLRVAASHNEALLRTPQMISLLEQESTLMGRLNLICNSAKRSEIHGKAESIHKELREIREDMERFLNDGRVE